MDNDRSIDINTRITTEFGDAYLNRSGYYVVRLSSDIYIPLHKLVCKKYVCDDLNNKEVHHKDGNKLNNHPSNLEPLTPNQHRLVHEMAKRNKRAHNRAKRKGVL